MAKNVVRKQLKKEPEIIKNDIGSVTNPWQMICYLLELLLVKGRLVTFAISITLIILVSKMPKDEIFNAFEIIIEIFKGSWFLGYALFVVSVIISALLILWLREHYQNRISKITAEKTALQKKLEKLEGKPQLIDSSENQ